MNCRELAELLFDFVSGDLTPEQHEVIETHLGECSPCFAYVETYRLTIYLSRQLPSQSLPPACEQRLRATVAQFFPERPSDSANA